MEKLKAIKVSGRELVLTDKSHVVHRFDVLDFYNFMYLCSTTDGSLPEKPSIAYHDRFPDSVYSFAIHGQFTPKIMISTRFISSNNYTRFQMHGGTSWNCFYPNYFYSGLSTGSFKSTAGRNLFKLLINRAKELENCLSLVPPQLLPEALLESNVFKDYLKLSDDSKSLSTVRHRRFVGNLVFFALFERFETIKEKSKAPQHALDFIQVNRFEGFVKLYKSEFRKHMTIPFFKKLFAHMIQTEEDALVLLEQIEPQQLTKQFFKHFVRKELSVERFLALASESLDINTLSDFISKLSRYDSNCQQTFNEWIQYEKIMELTNTKDNNRIQLFSNHPDLGQWLVKQIQKPTSLYPMLGELTLKPEQITSITDSIYKEGFSTADRLITLLWLKHYQNYPAITVGYLFLENLKALVMRINTLDSNLLGDFVEDYTVALHGLISEMFLDINHDLDIDFLKLLKCHHYHFSQESFETLFADCHVSLDKLNYLEPRINAFREALGLCESFELDIIELLRSRRAELRRPKEPVDPLFGFGLFEPAAEEQSGNQNEAAEAGAALDG